MPKAYISQYHKIRGLNGCKTRVARTGLGLLLLLSGAAVSAEDTTLLVKDINPGIGSSLPTNSTVYGGSIYFGANDGINGQELWVSDGTETGTVMLKNINAANNESSSPSEFAVYNGMLYFAADDGINGRELWVSDGTETGTLMLKNINMGTNESSSPSDLAVFNDKLYFAADDGVNGRELWVTDGTELGTVLIKDLNSGSGSSSPSDLTVFDGKLYFTADNGTSGAELWVLEAISSCEYPMNASLTEVAPWGPALIYGAPTVDALIDVFGTVSQQLTFYPAGDADGYQAMAMKSEMASIYPPSGEIGDKPLPMSGVIGYQVDLDKFFNPVGSAAFSVGMEIVFVSGTPSNNIAVSVGNHFNSAGYRYAYVRLTENGSIIDETHFLVGTDIDESASVGISIDRTNRKVYWSLDGDAPQAFQSSGMDHVYDHNGTHGSFFANANTGLQDVTGDSVTGDWNRSTLITCAAEMDQQFLLGAEDIAGTVIY